VTTKDRLHQLVDELPEGDVVDTAERLLAALRDHGDDPLARKLLSAPIEDEPEAGSERASAAEARRQMSGRSASHTSIRAELERRRME